MTSPTGAATPAVEMDDAECRDLLAAGKWGMLSMIGPDGPYAIPMAYGWDGQRVVIGVSEGLKTELLDADARCGFTVCEAPGGDRWRSVIVAGTVRWLATPEERMRAGQALRRQHAPAGAASEPRAAAEPQPASQPAAGASTSRRFSGGRMLEIANARITGRAKR